MGRCVREETDKVGSFINQVVERHVSNMSYLDVFVDKNMFIHAKYVVGYDFECHILEIPRIIKLEELLYTNSFTIKTK